MKKLMVLLGCVVALLVGVPATTSSAGGWVVVSLDSTPALREGDEVRVGFTVLRHGVTPENSDDLAMVLTDEQGRTRRFDVVQQGAVGHHVVAFDVPPAGAYTWKVTGQFVDAELGPISVSDPSRTEASGWGWDALQWGSVALAVLMGGLAGRDLLRTRRRRSAPAAAA